MASRRRKRMTLHQWDGSRVMDLGHVEIWDGADLSLIRDTLTELIVDEGHKHIGINMQYVKYIPSGFFGMLFDWHERGVEVKLYTPQPNVANMLWFRQFFEDEGEGSFRLLGEPKDEMVSDPQAETGWGDDPANMLAEPDSFAEMGW